MWPDSTATTIVSLLTLIADPLVDLLMAIDTFRTFGNRYFPDHSNNVFGFLCSDSWDLFYISFQSRYHDLNTFSSSMLFVAASVMLFSDTIQHVVSSA
ncbi:hypothetical protein C8J56DRAFT_928843 [Mycena floridula]|nr:hypothetical protein C8J56DRAFT_928843 [Mycena floridula]